MANGLSTEIQMPRCQMDGAKMTESAEPKLTAELDAKPDQKEKKERPPKWKRKGDIVAGVIANIIILWISYNIQNWLPWLFNNDYSVFLSVFSLTILAQIFAGVLLLLYNPKWLYHLVESFTNLLGTIGIVVFVVLFPLNLSEPLATIIRVAAVIGGAVAAIMAIVEFFRFIFAVAAKN